MLTPSEWREGAGVSREIDELVARRVFGMEYHERLMLWYVPGTGATLADGKNLNTWKPSEKIADAWEVVEKMRADGFSMQIETTCHHSSIGGGVAFAKGVHPPGVHKDQEVFAWPLMGPSGRPVPAAICLAALRAVGAQSELDKIKENDSEN